MPQHNRRTPYRVGMYVKTRVEVKTRAFTIPEGSMGRVTQTTFSGGGVSPDGIRVSFSGKALSPIIYHGPIYPDVFLFYDEIIPVIDKS